MLRLPDDLRLYLVTDEKPQLLKRVEAAIRGGVTCVQLRMKQASFNTFLKTAQSLKRLCQQYHVPLIINDHAEIAKRVRADGLHIGQDDLQYSSARQIVGPDCPIGVSVHTVEQAIQAEKEGAAYLGVGSLFPTPSKSDATTISFEVLQQIQRSVTIPIVVIGGINQHTFPKVRPYKPDGIAMISAILSADEPEEAARHFRRQLDLGNGVS